MSLLSYVSRVIGNTIPCGIYNSFFSSHYLRASTKGIHNAALGDKSPNDARRPKTIESRLSQENRQHVLLSWSPITRLVCYPSMWLKQVNGHTVVPYSTRIWHAPNRVVAGGYSFPTHFFPAVWQQPSELNWIHFRSRIRATSYNCYAYSVSYR